MVTWAQQLEGQKLEDDWTVLRAIERPDSATGGCFSRGYIVESATGREAYLKALDFSQAFDSDDPAKFLQQITAMFNFERTLCQKCRTSKLSRVVKIITDGKHRVDPSNPTSVVQYLVFELAHDDVRTRLDAFERLDTAWALRALHHVATALTQLHGIGIAHQDLKPSNVLVFPDDSAKVGDLGRCTAQDEAGPFDQHSIVGDLSYAPPELLYGHLEPDWHRRRLGCDAYLLGSMTVFFFTRVSMTSLIMSELQQEHFPEHWGDSYGDVLPYVRDAFGRAVDRFKTDVPLDLKEELALVVRQLCDPDPEYRGDPHQRGSQRTKFDLRRYVSKFNLLAEKAEHGLIQG